MKNDKLRLRGIDCPELKTSAGKAAKKFVEELFSRAEGVTVTTTKPDKFDRYLSDIFLRMKDGTELFLNNELLAAGHARLYNDPKPEDWGD
jgi:endonuclease YncB( thermonuclease family)